MGTDEEADTVRVDTRGRITIPRHIRQRFRIEAGDELGLTIREGEIHLTKERPGLQTISDDREWGEEAFLDAGEALFGGRDTHE